MNKIILILLLLPISVIGSPWVVSGQTGIPAKTGIDNPVPSDPGAIGQVTSLPYTVPANCTLMLTSYGIEGYVQDGISVVFIWTGSPATVTPQWRIDHATASAAARNGSNELIGQLYDFPEGTVMNIRLINGTTTANNWIFGWYASGDLVCA